MTTLGENRAAYAAAHGDTDPRPSRFSPDNAYAEWALRADEWALAEGLPTPRYPQSRWPQKPPADPPRPMVRVSADTWKAGS